MAPLVFYPKSTLQGCYHVLNRCELGYFGTAVSSVIACQPPNLARSRRRLDRPDRPSRCGQAVRVGVRGSAPMRRGAAPYGNGCEQISGHSHLISQCILSALLDLRAAFYTTF